MRLNHAFDILFHYFGTHKAAAKNLGISWVHYACIRNGRVHIPKRTEDLIILKAQEVKDKAPLP